MAEEASGQHLVCDMWTSRDLDSTELAEEALNEACKASGLSLLSMHTERFQPQGITAVALLAQSHLALHTWPERNYLAFDAFTCSTSPPIDEIVRAVERIYDVERRVIRTIARGKRPKSVFETFFDEDVPEGAMTMTYTADEVLRSGHTGHQDLTVFRSPKLGNVLLLDDYLQVAEWDSFVYAELMSHPALFAHEDPTHVGLIGGGDGFVLAEVLKHQVVQAVDVFELDMAVIDAARTFFPTSSAAFSDPRVHLHIGDAFETLPKLGNQYDVLIADTTDPGGQADRFFAEPFYSTCNRDYLEADGILVAQTESLLLHRSIVRRCYAAMQRSFAHAAVLWGVVPTYSGGWWTFCTGAKSHDPRVRRRFEPIHTRLYDASIHPWYFLPLPIEQAFLEPG